MKLLKVKPFVAICSLISGSLALFGTPVFAQSAESGANCNALASEYSHLAAVVDKNRMMIYKYSGVLDEQINKWSLQNLYPEEKQFPALRLFGDTRGNLGLVSSLDRNIIVQNDSGTANTKYTCSYHMSDFAGIAGAQYHGSENFTTGLIGLFDLGAFGFKDDIPNTVRGVDQDNALAIGGFFALDTPQLFNTQIESSVLYTIFDYETFMGEDKDSLRMNEGSFSSVRWNNYIAKHFLQGANAFQLKVGVNLEYWMNEGIDRTLYSGGATTASFKASRDITALNVEPTVAANYFRAWMTPSGDTLELNINGRIAYGLGSGSSFKVDLAKDIRLTPENAEGVDNITNFESTLFYSAGANISRSLGPFTANIGAHFDGMSDTGVSGSDLMLIAGISASF